MKPCGIILTYMSRQDWEGKSFWIKLRTIFFNAILFIFQLVFMVVGTAIGKIKWEKISFEVFLVCSLGIITCLPFTAASIMTGNYLLFVVGIILIVAIVATFRGIDWRRVWRAAQCSHVRLVLEEPDPEYFSGVWTTANFSHPEMEIQLWHKRWNDGKRFEYRDPTFPTPSEFMEPVIQYAHDQVGKRYDDYQLASPMANFLIWIFWWPLWGKEVIGWFNRPGGLEFCSSGVTADLRWGEKIEEEYLNAGCIKRAIITKFFKGYDTAMVMPCLFAIDENWEEAKQ